VSAVRVDVVGVIDAEMAAYAKDLVSQKCLDRLRRLREARLAIAELIEADAELDAAEISMRNAGRCGPKTRVARLHRLHAARERRAAALAVVGGTR
jgi:hypothetical protein